MSGKKKKGERGREKFGLVSDPSRKHSSEGVGLFERHGAVPLQAPQTGRVTAPQPELSELGGRRTPGGEMLHSSLV